jgi:hypothetical protein
MGGRESKENIDTNPPRSLSVDVADSLEEVDGERSKDEEREAHPADHVPVLMCVSLEQIGDESVRLDLIRLTRDREQTTTVDARAFAGVRQARTIGAVELIRHHRDECLRDRIDV